MKRYISNGVNERHLKFLPIIFVKIAMWAKCDIYTHLTLTMGSTVYLNRHTRYLISTRNILIFEKRYKSYYAISEKILTWGKTPPFGVGPRPLLFLFCVMSEDTLLLKSIYNCCLVFQWISILCL